GTGLIGMWKAFEELGELGWLKSPKRPRLVSCQSDGCAPIVRAFEAGERFAQPFPNAQTVASGLRVPAAVGDFMMLDAIRASDGCAIAGREDQIGPWMRTAASAEGVSVCPETAGCLRRIGPPKENGGNKEGGGEVGVKNRAGPNNLGGVPV